LNLNINEEKEIIEDSMFKFLKELEKRFCKMEVNKEGEIYHVDEIGDDEKYVFLTRESDNKEIQEFNISDELYQKLLNDVSIERLVFKDGKYQIID